VLNDTATGSRRIGPLRNLSPASERQWSEIGIRNEAELRAIASVAAVVQLKFVLGRTVPKNFLWAMEGRSSDATGAICRTSENMRLKQPCERSSQIAPQNRIAVLGDAIRLLATLEIKAISDGIEIGIERHAAEAG
jgi:hypothetical protein